MIVLSVPRKQTTNLVFLQNAWAYYEQDKPWTYDIWLFLLAMSRSGKRLGSIFNDIYDHNHVLFTNTTPIIGVGSSSIKLKPNIDYINEQIKRSTPTNIITCGTQAEKALKSIWTGNILSIPHPACRVVTNNLYKEAKEYIDSNNFHRIKLAQRKGFVETMEC